MNLETKCPLPEVGSPDWPWEDGYKEAVMPGGYRIRQTEWKETYYHPGVHEDLEIEEGEWICTHQSPGYHATSTRLDGAEAVLRKYEGECRIIKQDRDMVLSAEKKAAKKAGMKFGKKEEAAFYSNNPVVLPPHPYGNSGAFAGEHFCASCESVRALQRNNELSRWDWLKRYTEDWDERPIEEVDATSEDDNFEHIISLLKAECEQHARAQWFGQFLSAMNSEPVQ